MIRLLTLVVVAAVGLTGCTPAVAPTQRSFPPRPADLPIAGLRACDLLTEKQLEELDVVPRDPEEFASGSNDCTLVTSDSRFWTVRIQGQSPINQYDPQDPSYIGRTDDYQDPRITVLDGYGAVEFLYSLSGKRPGCNIAVDGKPGSTLLVNYSDNSAQYPDRPAAGRAESCALASRVASLVIGNLTARLPR